MGFKNISSLIQLQGLIFPLINAVGGPDLPSEFIAPGGDKLREAGLVMHEYADILVVAGEGLSDGRLTMDDVNATINEYEEASDALDALRGNVDPAADAGAS